MITEKLNENSGENPRLGSIGRLTAQKGYDTLLRTTANLKGKYRDLRVEIVGVGDERDKLEALSTQLNIADVVDVPSVAEYAKTLPYVEYTNDNLYSCSQDTQAHIRDMIEQVLFTSPGERVNRRSVARIGIDRRLIGRNRFDSVLKVFLVDLSQKERRACPQGRCRRAPQLQLQDVDELVP